MPDESSIIAALRTGDVHHAVLEDNKNYDLIKDNPSLQTWQTPPLGTNVININHRKEPLSNVQVRQAMSMAMSRDEILQAAGSGLGEVSGPIPSSHPQWTVPLRNLAVLRPGYRRREAGAERRGLSERVRHGHHLHPSVPADGHLGPGTGRRSGRRSGSTPARAPPSTVSGSICESRRSTTGSVPISISQRSIRTSTCTTRSTPVARRRAGTAGATARSTHCWTRVVPPRTWPPASRSTRRPSRCCATRWRPSGAIPPTHVDVATQQLQGFKPHPTTTLFGLATATLAG